MIAAVYLDPHHHPTLHAVHQDITYLHTDIHNASHIITAALAGQPLTTRDLTDLLIHTRHTLHLCASITTWNPRPPAINAHRELEHIISDAFALIGTPTPTLRGDTTW